MYTKLNKINEGFTIVETLIVLAIAALIITIVLIAVPDLQRSSRNTNITHDAQSIASGVQTYEGNNDGSIPTNTSPPAADGSVSISGASGAAATAHVQASDTITPESAKTSATGSKTVYNTITVDFGADCPSPDTAVVNGTAMTLTVDNRGVAILYEIQTSSNTGQLECLQE